VQPALSLSSSSLLRRWPLILLAVLLPIFSVGMFARGIWTPDEPREIAISWRMAHQDDKSLPHLGDEAFCEKPPLLYWLSGASMQTFGKSPAVARIPNLIFALIAAFSLALLARSMVLARSASLDAANLAALAAGVTYGTMELTWQVSVWLASDAPLLMGVAVALLGAWRGANAAPGRAKLGWYTLMHLGMLAGFMSKNVVGWIVPGLALGAWLAWEWRWREVLRWELWAGLPVQLAVIGWWSWSVWTGPDGHEHLRIFYVENLVGRFFPQYKGTKDYNSGHANWPGKYLFELPAYVMPWLVLAAAAVRRAWSGCRVATAERAGWRFAICVIVPTLLLLSAASTGRGIYLAPLMGGFALLIGLWAAEQSEKGMPGRFDRFALAFTALLLAGLAAILLPAAAVANAVAKLGIDSDVWIALGCCTVLGVMKLLVISTHLRRGNRPEVVRETLITLVALWCLAMIAAPRLVDRWQDLAPVARMAAQHGPGLALYDPDETTIATVEYHTGIIAPVIAEGDDAKWLAKPGIHALRKMPGKDGAYREIMDDMAKRGWQVSERIDIPFGRRYAIFVPRPPSTP
jgi:4-amino-4-deoxy-L-arabinose transferase-like glycosyltransferase